MPHKLLADIAKIHPRKLKGERLLEDFKRDVLPGMTYSGYSPDNHKCRAILETGIDDFLQRRLDQDNEVKRRDMESGKVYNRSRQKEVHAIKLEAANKLIEASLCENEKMREVHRAMLDDLNNLPLPLFQGLADRYYNEAWGIASHLPYEDVDDRRKRKLQLLAIRDMPKPFYHPVGQQARLYSSGGLPTIKKEVRRAFLPKEEGHLELDIACCNLSIAAGLWNIESIQEVQQSGGSVWSELLAYMEVSDELRAITKPILKQGVCSSIYGMKASNVEGQVTLELGGKTLKGKGENRHAVKVNRPVIPKVKRFADNPLIADLLQAIKLTKEEIIEDGGYNGAYGFIEYDGEEDIDSYLCRVIGSYELAIIASCFELARERGDFQVVLYQYDGVPIKLAKNDRPDRVASVLSAIQQRASQTAQSFGIYTTLEAC